VMLLVRRGTPLMWHGCDGFSFFLRRCWLGQHHFVPVTSPASLAWRSRGRAATSSCQRRWRLRASGPRERQRRLQGSAAGGPKAPWCAPWRRHGASRRQGREVPWWRPNFFSFICFPPSLFLSFPLDSLSSFGYWRRRLGMAKRRWRQWVL
jgi:hypothetical protein